MCNYAEGTVLIRTRHDRLTERRFYEMLRVDKIIRSPRHEARNTVVVQHEDGHKEALPIRRLDLPIERARFGYRVATADEALLFPTNL